MSGAHETRLERLATDKHSSLLRKFVNYGHKKFYSIGPAVRFESLLVERSTNYATPLGIQNFMFKFVEIVKVGKVLGATSLHQLAVFPTHSKSFPYERQGALLISG